MIVLLFILIFLCFCCCFFFVVFNLECVLQPLGTRLHATATQQMEGKKQHCECIGQFQLYVHIDNRLCRFTDLWQWQNTKINCTQFSIGQIRKINYQPTNARQGKTSSKELKIIFSKMSRFFIDFHSHMHQFLDVEHNSTQYIY